MTKTLALIILTGLSMPLMAQHSGHNCDTSLLFLKEYPYADVLKYIGSPDTLFFCHYPLRIYEENNIPTAVNLYIYRKNGRWWATSLVKFKSRKKEHWTLTKPLWIQTDLSKKMESALFELKEISYTERISTIYSWVHVEYGETISDYTASSYKEYFYTGIVPGIEPTSDVVSGLVTVSSYPESPEHIEFDPTDRRTIFWDSTTASGGKNYITEDEAVYPIDMCPSGILYIW